MIDKDIAEGKLGAIGSYDVEIKDSKLIAKVDANHDLGKAGVLVELDAAKIWDKYVDMAKAKIPGQIDDLIFDTVRVALFGPKV